MGVRFINLSPEASAAIQKFLAEPRLALLRRRMSEGGAHAPRRPPKSGRSRAARAKPALPSRKSAPPSGREIRTVIDRAAMGWRISARMGDAGQVPGIGWSSLVLSFASLGVVCLVAWGALRLLAGRGVGKASGAVRVVARCPLEPRRSVYVIEAAGRSFLIGVGDGPMTRPGGAGRRQAAKAARRRASRRRFRRCAGAGAGQRSGLAKAEAPPCRRERP